MSSPSYAHSYSAQRWYHVRDVRRKILLVQPGDFRHSWRVDFITQHVFDLVENRFIETWFSTMEAFYELFVMNFIWRPYFSRYMVWCVTQGSKFDACSPTRCRMLDGLFSLFSFLSGFPGWNTSLWMWESFWRWRPIWIALGESQSIRFPLVKMKL